MALHDGQMSLRDFARENREVIGSFDRRLNFDLTLFVGLHNSNSFIQLVRGNLESQQDQNFFLLIVDNASEDSTWALVEDLVHEMPGKAVGVRNPTNLGGTGSFMSNLDLCPTEWIATLHQDDYYLKNHVSILKDIIRNAASETALVATSMGRLKEGQKGIGIIPRANWLLDADSRNVDYFLATLRNHIVPFPAAAFRISFIRNQDLSWHDTSFPDSEMVLKVCVDKLLVISEEITVGYRENPKSESHSLTEGAREHGQYLALLRVFSSQEFINLAKSLRPCEQRNFFVHAKESVSLRLKNPALASPALLVLAESLAIAWNYSCTEVNEYLLEQYRGFGSRFSQDFLRHASDFSSNKFVGWLDGRSISGNLHLSEDSSRLRAPFFMKSQRLLFTLVLKFLARLRIRRDFDFKWLRR
jgi:glycosyltransferase involved in cell wall biosynthesis